MGLSIYRVPRRLYWTADKDRLVEHGDVDARFLAFPAGHEMSLEEARRFRLLDRLDTPISAAPAEKLGAAPLNKARVQHVDKSATPTAVTIENTTTETTTIEPVRGKRR